MNKPTKIFIAGTGLAAGLAAFCAITNTWNSQRAERLTEQVEVLTEQCELKEGVKSPDATLTGPLIGSFASKWDAYEAKAAGKGPPPGDYILVERNGRYGWQLMVPGDVRCSPIVLVMKGADTSAQFDDIQRVLAEKQKEALAASRPMELPYLIAFGMFLISALPVVMVSSWYFLLRRIRELSAAIRGRG